MNKLIRHSVFETNSSSCHSICVKKGMELNNIPYVDTSGNIEIPSGEFGWEINSYDDFYSKAAYLAIYIRDWSDNNLEKFKELFESIIKEFTGCETISYEDKFWDTEIREYEYEGTKRTYKSKLGEGYIDHQSVEDNDLDYLFDYIELMKVFLFSSQSVLHTDNDNH